jgi:carbonic anhydrase
MSQPLSNAARVRVIGLIVLFLASGATIWAGLRNRRPAEPPPPDTPETALAELKAGNERFQKAQRTRSAETRADGDRRKATAKGQHPIAAVLGCADSRVVPDFLFDQSFGGIFDVSNAGNVVDSDVLGSMEYAVEHLHVPLVVVLGHTSCGAVEAAANAGQETLPGFLKDVQGHMQGVRTEALKAGEDRPADFFARLAANNARTQARRLVGESKVLREAVKKKDIAVAVGLYDLESGAVEWQDFDPELEK